MAVDKGSRPGYNEFMAAQSDRSRPATTHATIIRELLVRYLEVWAPAALHSSRRVTYLAGYAGSRVSGAGYAAAVLGVFADFADLLVGRQLSVILVAGEAAPATRLPTLPDQVRVRVVAEDAVVATLSGTDVAGAPLFAFLDAAAAAHPPPDPATVTAIAGARASELLLTLDSARVDAADHRQALTRSGFRFVTGVELVDEAGRGVLLLFGTGSAKSLETFKDELWAVDEYAGIRYRDPGDPAHELLDISLTPHLGPLRRALLDRVASVGECTVAQLREYSLTETVYRAADATRVLGTLVTGGLLVRYPEKGRLTAETRLRSRGA